MRIGTDIVNIERIERLVEKYGEKILKRILVATEIDRYKKLNQDAKYAYLAKRFAAKEAISKAFGCGIGVDLAFTDIIIENDISGKPMAKLVENHKFASNKIALSLADDKPFAVAFAMICD